MLHHAQAFPAAVKLRPADKLTETDHGLQVLLNLLCVLQFFYTCANYGDVSVVNIWDPAHSGYENPLQLKHDDQLSEIMDCRSLREGDGRDG